VIPVDLAVTMLVCFFNFAREAAGAAGTRHSPRPLLGERFMHGSGASRREDAGAYLDVIARSDLSAVAQRTKVEATKQSIVTFVLAVDCFAEPVIGRAFARPVGSQ
jgi:hypothetical protein